MRSFFCFLFFLICFVLKPGCFYFFVLFLFLHSFFRVSNKFLELLITVMTVSFLFLKLQISGMTPLMYAVKDNRTSYLDRLIELGSDVCARNNVGCIQI